MAAPSAHATLLLLSTSGDAELAGLTFSDGDLVLFDTTTSTASLFFDGNLFKRDEDINAIDVLDSGNLLLSTRTNATLGGLDFRDGDIVEYNPLTDTASLFFSEDKFERNEEVSAFSLLDDGTLVLSTRGRATLGGLRFEKQDLVVYDMVADQSLAFFDGDLFARNQNISATHVFNNGNIALSTRKKATLGGLTFGDDAIVEYNPVTNSASLLFDGSLFSNNYEDIDALYVFENSHYAGSDAAVPVAAPGGLALLFSSLMMLGSVRRRA